MTATIIGSVRIYAADASMSRKDVIFGDASTVLLGLGATDPRLSLIVPFTPKAELKEDDILIISTNSIADGNIDSTAVWRIPVTIKNMTTGIVRQSFLGIPDFTTMAGSAIGSTDILSPAGIWTDIVKYTVKPQERLILGHQFAENSRIMLTMAVT
jgi:hypothetical protein